MPIPLNAKEDGVDGVVKVKINKMNNMSKDYYKIAQDRLEYGK